MLHSPEALSWEIYDLNQTQLSDIDGITPQRTINTDQSHHSDERPDSAGSASAREKAYAEVLLWWTQARKVEETPGRMLRRVREKAPEKAEKGIGEKREVKQHEKEGEAEAKQRKEDEKTESKKRKEDEKEGAKEVGEREEDDDDDRVSERFWASLKWNGEE